MRIGVIADTHIPDRADSIPPKILEDFKHVDMIIHAGDLVDLKVMEQLKSICKNVRAVWGNMDPYEVRKEIPEKQVFEVAGFKIAVMHGWGSSAALMELLGNIFKNEHPDIIIFGHAHSAFNEKRQDILYFNPGSPTDKVYSPYNSYGIIEIGDKIEAKIIKI